jgi:hypothetical protein
MVQEAPQQRKGESPTTVGGPREMEHILKGGIYYDNIFKAM